MAFGQLRNGPDVLGMKFSIVISASRMVAVTELQRFPTATQKEPESDRARVEDEHYGPEITNTGLHAPFHK